MHGMKELLLGFVLLAMALWASLVDWIKSFFR